MYQTLTTIRGWLRSLSEGEVALYSILLVTCISIIGFLTRHYFFNKARKPLPDAASKPPPQTSEIVLRDGTIIKIASNSSPELIKAIESLLSKNYSTPDSAEPNRQVLQAAVDDVAALERINDAADKVITEALNAAAHNQQQQALEILSPLRATYAQQADSANRNLARLAYVTATLIFANDPQQARPYLAEAAQLAPDNFWYLINYGRDLELTGDSTAAKQVFTQAYELAQSEANKRNQSVALNDIGDIQQAQGGLDAALVSYQASLEIRQALAQHDPSNARWQVNLASSYAKIAQLDGQDARQYWQRAHDILQPLHASNRLSFKEIKAYEYIQTQLAE